METNTNRKYFALSIKHSSGKLLDSNVLFCGTITEDQEKRSFSGYVSNFENAELYTLEEFNKSFQEAFERWLNYES